MDGIIRKPASKQPAHIDAQTLATIVTLIPWGKVVIYDELLARYARPKESDFFQIDGILPYSKSFLFKPVERQSKNGRQL